MIKSFKLSMAGVDVGSRTLKGLKLRRKSGRVYIDSYFFANRLSTGSAGLKALTEINGFSHERVAFGLSDDLVTIHDVVLPEMPKKEIYAAVCFEVSNQTGISESENAVDYKIISTEMIDGIKHFKIKAYSTPRSNVAEKINELKLARLRPFSAETKMGANLAALKFNEYIQDNGNYAIIDLGDSETSIGFIKKGELTSAEVAKTGSARMNALLESRFNLSKTQSEKVKLDYRFSAPETGISEEQSIVEDVYCEIFQAIKTWLEEFREANPEVVLDELFLVGGGSKAEGIASVMEMFFGIPATIANPFRKIEIYQSGKNSQDDLIGSLGAYMTTAVGLAIRGI